MAKKKTANNGKSIVVVIPVDNKNNQLCLVSGRGNEFLNFPFRHVNKRKATQRTADEILYQHLIKTINDKPEHITELAISFAYKVGKSMHRVFVFIVGFEGQTALQNGTYINPIDLCHKKVSPLCSRIIQELHKKAA